MSILQSIILGLVQGISEFLPISSSGHLEIFSYFWTGQDLIFDVFLHLGTLTAVIFYFRKEILKILFGFFKVKSGFESEGRLGWIIILGTIPAVFFGFLIQEVLNVDFRSPVIVAVNLIFWGIVLWFADFYMTKVSKNNKKTDLKEVSWKEALFIGFFQILSLIPGTSRSGITMTAGLFSKMDRETSANFSFLLSIPVIAGAGFLSLFELIKNGIDSSVATTLFFGFVSSVVGGFVAIHFLLKIIKKYSFFPFVVYRIILGLLILFLIF